jgi:hypothetical protein
MPVHPDILDIVSIITDRLVGEGAVAVMLMGSHVRGDAHPHSDIDMVAIGDGPDYVLERSYDHLVSLSWKTFESFATSFENPSAVGGVVPGLRECMILHDPEGVALRLKQQAVSWDWDSIGVSCDAQVADEVTGLAEEVHRLVGCLDTGNMTMAAVLRSILSFRMASILSLHLRILYNTENRIWDLVNREMGEHWTEVQGRAFGLNDESFRDTCDAALELYTIAGAQVQHLLDENQREVVEHACAAAGYPLCGDYVDT